MAVLHALAVPGFRLELDCQTLHCSATSMGSTAVSVRVNDLGRLLTLLGWVSSCTSIGDIPRSSPGSEYRIILPLRDRWQVSRRFCRRYAHQFLLRPLTASFTAPHVHTKHSSLHLVAVGDRTSLALVRLAMAFEPLVSRYCPPLQSHLNLL